VAETAMLLVAGGAAGIALASWAADLLHAFQPGFSLPLRFDLSLDARVLAFAVAMTGVAGAIVGLAPAWQATGLDLVGALRDTRGHDRGTRARLRHALVVGQVALSMVLLVAAGLFVRTVQRASAVDPGFDPSGVSSARVDL
jgi:hypothetical protein